MIATVRHLDAHQKWILIGLILAAVLKVSWAGAADNSFGTPNTEQELRLQQIFDKYNSEPVDDEKWQSMLGARSSESYKIQTGDTLWDLSETMFGDGSYWPKLWSENRSIENPHQIVPKKQVRFIAGNEAQAPTVRIVENEAPKPYYIEDTHENLTAEEIAGGSIIEDPDIIGRKPEIPPAPTSKNALLRNLPPSFKLPIQQRLGNFDKTGLDVGEVKALKAPASVTLNSFISSEVPRKLGFVKEIEVQEKTASIFQSVFLELGRRVKVGDTLNIVVAKNDLKDDSGKDIGHVVEVGGSVEITEVINEDDGIYKAIIIDCVMPIEVNAWVTDEPLPKASFAVDGPRKNIRGLVVGGEYSPDRKILGTASVVYLNIGSENGVQFGDLLAVRSIRKSRRIDTDLQDVSRPIGVVKIAKVSQTASTALILSTVDEIRPGDMTGGEFPQQKIYHIGVRKDTVDVQDSEDEEEESNFSQSDLEEKAPAPPATDGVTPAPSTEEKPLDIDTDL